MELGNVWSMSMLVSVSVPVAVFMSVSLSVSISMSLFMSVSVPMSMSCPCPCSCPRPFASPWPRPCQIHVSVNVVAIIRCLPVCENQVPAKILLRSRIKPITGWCNDNPMLYQRQHALEDNIFPALTVEPIDATEEHVQCCIPCIDIILKIGARGHGLQDYIISFRLDLSIIVIKNRLNLFYTPLRRCP